METEVPPTLTNALSAGNVVTLDHVVRGLDHTLTLLIAANSDDASKGWKAWVIKGWSQSHEYRLADSPVAVVSIRFLDRHPLLLYRAKVLSELSFNDQPHDVDLMLQDMKAAHERVAADFIPFLTYMNARHNECDDLRTMVASGHGVFAAGPDALMQAYADVLTRHGCRAKLLAAPHLSSDTRPGPRVLELAPAGVVMGTAFQFRTCASRRKYNDLVERLRGW